MMSLTFGLFTQVSGSGPLGPLVYNVFFFFFFFFRFLCRKLPFALFLLYKPFLGKESNKH